MKRFNVRVYGILRHEDQVLLCHETMGGVAMTKFPGGGLKWGEGLLDCLAREMKEELGVEIGETHHFYTTDFFQQSMFDQNDQIIAVYYTISVRTREIPAPEEGLQFSWKKLSHLNPEALTLPIDKIVANRLLKI